jgi:molecular chaperone GrpE
MTDRPEGARPAPAGATQPGDPAGGSGVGGQRPDGPPGASGGADARLPTIGEERHDRPDADTDVDAPDSGIRATGIPAAESSQEGVIDGDSQLVETSGSSEAPGDAAVDAPAEDLSSEVEPDPMIILMAQRDDYRDALIRMQADFENYKKRMIKQQTDHLERAAEALVDKLLPVLDTADLALAHGGGEDVKQVSAALAGVLEREGLERIDPVGAPFDPTLHDAVAHEPADGGQQEVVEVLRAGYRWKGRVLRPAMVKVRG